MMEVLNFWCRYVRLYRISYKQKEECASGGIKQSTTFSRWVIIEILTLFADAKTTMETGSNTINTSSRIKWKKWITNMIITSTNRSSNLFIWLIHWTTTSRISGAITTNTISTTMSNNVSINTIIIKVIITSNNITSGITTSTSRITNHKMTCNILTIVDSRISNTSMNVRRSTMTMIAAARSITNISSSTISFSNFSDTFRHTICDHQRDEDSQKYQVTSLLHCHLLMCDQWNLVCKRYSSTALLRFIYIRRSSNITKTVRKKVFLSWMERERDRQVFFLAERQLMSPVMVVYRFFSLVM